MITGRFAPETRLRIEALDTADGRGQGVTGDCTGVTRAFAEATEPGQSRWTGPGGGPIVAAQARAIVSKIPSAVRAAESFVTGRISAP